MNDFEIFDFKRENKINIEIQCLLSLQGRAMELAEHQDECDKSDACSSDGEEQNLQDFFDEEG